MPITRDPAPQKPSDVHIPETVVRQMIRLVGEVADLRAERAVKRRRLMTGLARMIDADAWAWIISRAADDNSNPAVASFQHGGFSEEQVGRYVQLMQDRRNTPVEYAALNQLRRSKKRFTRRWDQLVTAEEWYGPRNRSMLEVLGFEHVMYSVRILDDDGFFSGITLKRRTGRKNFSPLEQRMAHIVTGEIEWLHCEENLAGVTEQIRPMTPSQRTVLMLLMEGLSKKEIAAKLDCSENTVKDHVKAIYKHFGVHSTPELFHYFMAGDGHDVD